MTFNKGLAQYTQVQDPVNPDPDTWRPAVRITSFPETQSGLYRYMNGKLVPRCTFLKWEGEQLQKKFWVHIFCEHNEIRVIPLIRACCSSASLKRLLYINTHVDFSVFDRVTCISSFPSREPRRSLKEPVCSSKPGALYSSCRRCNT